MNVVWMKDKFLKLVFGREEEEVSSEVNYDVLDVMSRFQYLLRGFRLEKNGNKAIHLAFVNFLIFVNLHNVLPF